MQHGLRRETAFYHVSYLGTSRLLHTPRIHNSSPEKREEKAWPDMDLQKFKADVDITLNCQKRNCPHRNCAPDEWASLELFWCAYCKRVWCEMCWDNVDAHEMIDERTTAGLYRMTNHNEGKFPLQNEHLQQILMRHQHERRSLLVTQNDEIHNERLLLLTMYEQQHKKRPNEPSKEEQDDHMARLIGLEQQNKRRLMKARAEQQKE